MELSKLDEIKIMNLLYSGEPANDLLAFELSKHLEMDFTLLSSWICIQRITKDKQLKKDISNYLLKEVANKLISSSDLNILTYIVQFICNVRFHDYHKLNKDFVRDKDISNMLFFMAMRTRYHGWKERFLIFDKGVHPKRKLVLDLLSNPVGRPGYSGSIYLPGLLFNELEELAEKLITKQKSNPGHVFITDLKTDILPSNFQQIYFRHVKIKNQNQDFLTIFPKYFFSLPRMGTLELSIDNVNIFPKNNQQRVVLNTLDLHCSNNVEFVNFDFLNLFSNLKLLYIKGGFLSHPNILLGHSKMEIYISSKFTSTAGYKINIDQKAISNIVNYLNEIPFSMKERAYFFPKFLALRNPRNLSFFSDMDLKKLESFLPFGFRNSRVIHRTIRRELRLRNLGKEINNYIQQL